jgi:hypothetical protein
MTYINIFSKILNAHREFYISPLKRDNVPLESLKSFLSKNTTLLLILTLIYFITALPGLTTEVLNPDGINWQNRSNDFVSAFTSLKFKDTYRAYHPGVSLMWISSTLFALTGLLFGKTVGLSADAFFFDNIGKFGVVIVSTLLFFLSLKLLSKFLSNSQIWLFSLFSILEPFLIGCRRLYHLDYLMYGFLFVSFLFFFIFFYLPRKDFPQSLLRTNLNFFLGSLFFSFGLLTKSTAILFFPVVLFIVAFSKNMSIKNKFFYAMALPFTVSLLFSLFFPAMWDSPVSVIKSIKKGASAIGIEQKKEIGSSGKSQNIIDSESADETNRPLYYFQSLVFRLSPQAQIFILVSVILFGWHVIRKRPLNWYLIGIFLIYILVFLLPLTFSLKKSERYGLFFYPLLFLFISLMFERIKKVHLIFLSFIYIVLMIPQYLQIYPYFYSYSNPLFGGVSKRVEVLYSSPFGIATYEVYNSILADMHQAGKFGSVSGNKSLKLLSSDFKVHTSKTCEADYFLHFTPEKSPEAICSKNFELIKTVRIGNFDYWNVYKKRSVK